MRTDIEAAGTEGADGVVIGMLTEDSRLDRERMAELVALARPMAVTCYRAFDMARDAAEALETLILLGIERVLTSGQETSVPEGLPMIAALVRQAGPIIVMPGGGITERNFARIAQGSGAEEFHFAALLTPTAPCGSGATMCSWRANCAPEFARAVTSGEAFASVMRQPVSRL